ncbi:hypothetical protein [Streptomyces collinus]|uniref:hypothetical protein n=1 Tax=Streptomyces collinus TaxID=42684 RepID=UPI00294279F0|nr:hypothetical protein [Streptomyces collinus]
MAASYALRGVSIVVAVIAVAGCSSDEQKQEFTVPKALCGVSVPTESLSSLLPASGKQLSARRSGGPDDGAVLCNVSVDGDRVLVISQERISVGDSARHILLSRLSVPQPKSAARGSIAYADRAAVSLLKCRGADVEKEDISTLVKVLEPARRDESAMKDLIQGYTTSLEGQHPCKAAP